MRTSTHGLRARTPIHIARSCSSVKNRTVYPGDVRPRRVTFVRHPCTPPLPLEAFSENISTSTGSSKEIYSGFEEEEEYDDTKIVKSRIRVFLPEESKVGINTWGLYTARDGPESCCWCVLKA